jgi:hypothetical protein
MNLRRDARCWMLGRGLRMEEADYAPRLPLHCAHARSKKPLEDPYALG